MELFVYTIKSNRKIASLPEGLAPVLSSSQTNFVTLGILFNFLSISFIFKQTEANNIDLWDRYQDYIDGLGKCYSAVLTYKCNSSKFLECSP